MGVVEFNQNVILENIINRKMRKRGSRMNTNVKLPLGRKSLFMFGMFANAIMVYFITYYLSYFGTDIVGLSAASVTLLLVIVKNINAYQDPILGGILDRLPPNPKGKYRTWIIIGVLGCAIGYSLLFSDNPNWSYGVKLAWFYVFYTLGNFAASIHTTSYGAYQQVLTTDTDERSAISMWRMVGTGIGSVVPGLLAVVLLTAFSGGEEYTAKGFSGAVIVYCVIGAILGVLCTKAGKEVVIQKQRQKISLKETARYIRKQSSHRLCGFGLRKCCDMGVCVKCEACGVVSEHPGDGFDVYAVLQSQGCKCVTKIVEAKPRQSRTVEHTVQHIQYTVR